MQTHHRLIAVAVMIAPAVFFAVLLWLAGASLNEAADILARSASTGV